MAEAKESSEEIRPPARKRSQFSRLERSVNACQRCRGRKQKCDLQYPKCSSCVRTGSRCLIFDTGKGMEIPRSYVHDLENEVAALRAENEFLRRQQQVSTPNEPFSSAAQHPPSSETSQSPDPPQGPHDGTDLVVSMARVALGSTNEPRFMGTSSGITLAKLVMAAIELPVTPSPAETLCDPPVPLSTAPASLPSRRASDHIVEIYFQHRSPYFTFLKRQTVQESFDIVYTKLGYRPNVDSNSDRHTFMVYMVLAIGLSSGLKSHTSSTKQSEGCFNSALKHIDAVFAYSKSDLETLTCVLLLAQYVTLCPSKGSLWHITGVALRLCVDLGLHWEGSSITRENLEFIDTRRRLWWTTYKIERLLCITLGRPFGIVDQSTSVGLPSVTVDDPQISAIAGGFDPQKRVSNHLATIYQLESEIKHVLYHQFKPESQFKASPLAFPRPNYDLWLPDITKRLEEWYENIPCTRLTERQGGYQTHSWWTSFYNNALLLLHRPSPILPNPTTASFFLCFKAAREQILNIRDMYRDNNIDMVWVWVHRLFLAGITSTYCLWHSPELRQQTKFEDLIETTQACSSVLSALAERFPGAAGCRDSYDKLSVATMKYFAHTPVTPQYAAIHHTAYMGGGIMPQHEDRMNASSSMIEAPQIRQRDSEFPVPHDNQLYLQSLDGFPRDFLLPLEGMQFGEMFPFDDMELGQTLNSAAEWPVDSNPNYFPE